MKIKSINVFEGEMIKNGSVTFADADRTLEVRFTDEQRQKLLAFVESWQDEIMSKTITAIIDATKIEEQA